MWYSDLIGTGYAERETRSGQGKATEKRETKGQKEIKGGHRYDKENCVLGTDLYGLFRPVGVRVVLFF
jgi:hypothetical protein